MAMQVGSSERSSSREELVLTLGEPGNVDTYTFDATVYRA